MTLTNFELVGRSRSVILHIRHSVRQPALTDKIYAAANRIGMYGDCGGKRAYDKTCTEYSST
jgi:hypothetical protein